MHGATLGRRKIGRECKRQVKNKLFYLKAFTFWLGDGGRERGGDLYWEQAKSSTRHAPSLDSFASSWGKLIQRRKLAR